ncbi:MAG: type II restriction endonuclease, partial [Aquificota bacterium]
VDNYREMWGFDEEIALWLKYFTGEVKPPEGYARRDHRRLFFDEMPEMIREKIVDFFRKNKMLVVCDVLKGRGALSADWLIVARYVKEKDITDFAISDINIAINFFGRGDVRISPMGNLYIGRITMQRKGGTPDPTKLQFKIKPCQIFELRG